MIRKWMAGLVVLGMLLTSAPVFANSAETVPEGIFVLGFKFGWQYAQKRFGKSFGTDTVSITNDYNITVMGKDLNDSFGEDDKIGTLNAKYENLGLQFTFTAAYGITDNLSAMLILPVNYVRNRYSFELEDSNLYLVRDKGGNPVAITNDANRDTFSSMEVSDHYLNATEFEDVLSCTADTPLCQFQFKGLREWSRWGVREIIGGMRYKIMETKKWRQGLTLFGKFPTGRQVDTDDLFDTNFGDQQVDLGFWYGIDYTPIEHLMFNISLGYTEQLPEVKEKRIFSRMYDENGKVTGTLPLGPYWQKMKIHRDIGGNWDVYFGFNYATDIGLSFNNEFYFFWKYKDNFWAAETAPRDPISGLEWVPDFQAMEYGTDQSVLEMTNSIGFSTLPYFLKGKFPMPLIFSIGYTVGLAGQNFEQNHQVWASLDLIASIYMFESGEESEQAETSEDFQLPAAVQNEDESDPYGKLAKESKKSRENAERANRFNANFGKTRKFNGI